MEKLFDTIPIPKLVLRLGLPAMAAQFFNILYSITDRIFVGMLPDHGANALGAVGVCAPALTALSAISFLVGSGGSASMSICLGQGDRKTAQSMLDNAVRLLLLLSLLCTVLALLFQKPLLYLLGCSDALYPLAKVYFIIYVSGTVFALLGSGLNQFLLSQGMARQGMIAVIIGALGNTILDPVFIFVFDLGIAGAAAATVLSQLLSLLYVLAKLRSPALTIRLRLGPWVLSAVKSIFRIGWMPFFIALLDNLILIVLNMVLRHYGGDTLGDQYITCAAVVQSFLVLITLPLQGMTTGCNTLFGYHYGAKNYRKVMQTFRSVFIMEAVYVVLLLLFAQLTPEFFVRFFLRDAEDIALAAQFIRAYTMGALGIAVQFTIVDGLTAMGKVRYALPPSFFRKFFFLFLLVFLPKIAPLSFVFYAETIADVIGSCLTLTLFFTFIRKKLKKELTVFE